MLLAREIMSREVSCILEDTKLHSAFSIMQENCIRHLPVVNSKEEIVGMLSEGDILLNSDKVGEQLHFKNISVKKVMTRDVITCYPSSSLGVVAATMLACKIDAVPVVSGKKVVGIITTADFLDLFCIDEELNGKPVMPLSFARHNERGKVAHLYNTLHVMTH